MQIVYSNASYPQNDTRGKSAKIRQIVDTSLAMEHKVTLWKRDGHASAPRLPVGRLARLRALRKMDAILVLIEATPHHTCRYGLAPYRQVLNNPVMAWEFNSVPEFLGILGRSKADIQRSIQGFRSFAPGCDLAICVSNAMAEYVQDRLGVKRVMTIPNGSDPDLFNPDVTPVRRVVRSPDQLNVAWIGSAELSWHNFALMSQAAEILWQRGKGAQIAFHLIGSHFGAMRDMPPNIFYYGGDDYLQIPHWLAAMDVGLCLYHPGVADYNSPLKLFDYMSSGLAVIGTIQPQVCEVFQQLGRPDLAVPPDDPGVLADLLWQFAQDRPLVKNLGLANRQLVLDHYNWRRAVKELFAALDAIHQERG